MRQLSSSYKDRKDYIGNGSRGSGNSFSKWCLCDLNPFSRLLRVDHAGQRRVYGILSRLCCITACPFLMKHTGITIEDECFFDSCETLDQQVAERSVAVADPSV